MGREGDHEHTCQCIRNERVHKECGAPRSGLTIPLLVPHRPHQLRRLLSPHSQSSSSREMPSTTSDRKVQSRIKATNVARAARASSESSDTSPERGEGIGSTSSGPEDLDQPWPYEFKVTVKESLALLLNVLAGSGSAGCVGSYPRGWKVVSRNDRLFTDNDG